MSLRARTPHTYNSHSSTLHGERKDPEAKETEEQCKRPCRRQTQSCPQVFLLPDRSELEPNGVEEKRVRELLFRECIALHNVVVRSEERRVGKECVP